MPKNLLQWLFALLAGALLAAAVAAEPTICLPRPRGPLVHLTVAATTILGLDHEPGTLHGRSLTR